MAEGSVRPHLAGYTDFMRRLAKESGDVITPLFFDPGLGVDEKSDHSPVTVADRRAEELLRERIHATYPSHGIIGEEYGSERADAEFVWVLDPIDGTKSFTTGCPLFGTLVALLHQGHPVLGLIHQPVLQQLVLGDGETTTLNGKPIRVRATSELARATLLLTDRRDVQRHRDIERFERLEAEARLVRTWGDCYGYLLLSAGFADIMLDPVMNAWDLLALVPVVRGAGGRISDWSGNEPGTSTDSIVAAVPALHQRVIDLLNEDAPS
jgi:histidinol phosphatase-like enzyme (inositol monophosphatase family)